MLIKRIFFITIVTFGVMLAGCFNQQFDTTDIAVVDEELNVEDPPHELSWNYPLKPGMLEWYQLKTEKERIDALQVPEEILLSLTPEDFVELCISFPHFGYYTAFNSSQDGFIVMLNNFNIFRHLMTRIGAGKCLIDIYRDAGMTGFKKLPYSNDFWTIKLGYIELLLTQPKVLNSLTSEEKDNLLLEARKKCSEKLLHDDYSNYGVHFPVRIMASILDMEDYPELITSSNRLSAKKFIENGIYDDVSLFDEIINITDNYINSKNQNE